MKSFLLLFSLFFVSIALHAQPKNNAATPPTRGAADVISIYGGVYTNISGVNYNPGWGQSGAVNPAFDPGTGDVVLAYTNFNFQGTGFEGNAQNASEMEYVHIDIWTNNATNVKFTPIDNSGTGAGETLVEVPVKSGEWNSIDLPKSAFTGMTWKSVFQLKFDCQGGTSPSDIYLDNIYFWKKPAATGEDATLKDLKIDGTTLPGFAPSALNYSYGVAGGGSAPQITVATTNDDKAKVTKITQATTVPGDATILVTAGNGTTTATYTISYFYSSPENPAPTPTNKEVISLYSDAYTNVTVDTWNTAWSQATFEATTIKGNATLKYTNVGFNGIETTSKPIDASSMKSLHMDVWTPNVTVFNVKLVSFMGDGFAGANGDSEANLNANLTANTWNRIEFPLSDFTNAGLKSLSDLNQFIFTSTPFGAGIVYIDNIYFANDKVSGIQDKAEVHNPLYPNPVNQGSILYTNDAINSIEVFNINGQKVLETKESSFSIAGLIQGMYTVKMFDISGAISIQKLIIR